MCENKFFSYKSCIFVPKLQQICMETKDLNRIKVMLVEKKRTNKWLAEQLGKDPATISKWVTNVSQPSLANLIEISKLLEVEIKDLIRIKD